jgi:sarcosine oxidase subunit gamma
MLEARSKRTACGADAPLHLTVTSERALLEIRSWLPEHKLGQQSATLMGRALPSEVGATQMGPLQVMCLAPAEWLLVAPGQWAATFGRHVAAASEQELVLLDVTDAYATLRVRGRAAGAVLSKGCGVDLHPRAFPSGRCARTRFAHVPLIIHHIDDERGFDLHIARSCLRWLAHWLQDAALEFTGCTT